MYICSRRDVITVECLDGICAFCWFIFVFCIPYLEYSFYVLNTVPLCYIYQPVLNIVARITNHHYASVKDVIKT